MGIKGDMKGDGMQLGGTLVVSKGGEKLLLCHKQTNPGDHTNTEEVLKALGIAAPKETEKAGAEADEGGTAAAGIGESNEIACECDAEAEKTDDAKADEVNKDSEPAKTAEVEAKETAPAEAPEMAKAEEPEKQGDEPAATAAEDVAEGAKDEGDDGEAKGDAPKE